MKKLVVMSPAKVNLYLDVLRRRSDGYHEIETVFEKISIFDIITINQGKNGIKITSSDPKLPTGSGNLAYKAAKAVFDSVKYKGGVCIDITKNIPVSAGLGGGSSDAAAVLTGLNRFFRLGLNEPNLADIASTLGSDVPFFIYDHSVALGKCRGEVIEPVKTRGLNIWHVIVSFDFGMSTRAVYSDPNLRLTPGPVGVKMPACRLNGRELAGRPPYRSSSDAVAACLGFLAKNDIENLAACLYNKLEEVVLNKYKVLRAVKGLLLKEGAYGAILSGSGSTIFGITKTREEAIAVKRRVLRVIGSKYPSNCEKRKNPWRINKVIIAQTVS